MSSGNPHKIHIRIGDAEFTAEGAQEAVSEQFARFIEVLSKAPTAPAVPSGPAARYKVSETPPADDNHVVVGDDVLHRVYSRDEQFGVLLKILPKTERAQADALLLLLHGFAELMNQRDVLGGTLIRAARQSGVQIERVDTVLEFYDSLTTKAGFKRGRKYGLNLRGTEKAREILKGLL